MCRRLFGWIAEARWGRRRKGKIGGAAAEARAATIDRTTNTATEAATTLREAEALTEAAAWREDAGRNEATGLSEAAEAAHGEGTGSGL